MSKQFDVVVIGGGPGGYIAAIRAAQLGFNTACIDAWTNAAGGPAPGGTCTNVGCIPSKALLQSSEHFEHAGHSFADHGIGLKDLSIDVKKMLARKNTVVKQNNDGILYLFKKNKVSFFHGRGAFAKAVEGGYEVTVGDETLVGKNVIVATGSSARALPGTPFDEEQILSNDGALKIGAVPKKLGLIGAGVIGLEMGSVYANLGSKVTVVELLDGLLMAADRDLVKPLQKRLEHLFDKRIYLNTKVGSMAEVDNQIEVTFEGPGKYGHERFDRVLVSVGRRPVSRGIGLENTQVELTKSGFAVIDSQQRTADPHIFAIGDVAGEPMLAHKASHEAKVAIEVLLGEPATFDKAAIPAVVFTDPEIAWAGLTEEEAKKSGRVVDVEVYPWAASGRAQALGRTEGLTKWLVDPETHRVLGCGIVGAGAGELIAEAVLAIEMGCEVRDLTEAIHPHPTLSETLMNAGEVHFGTATEIYKPKRH